jgi:16S rRNA processing protein RimM
MAAARPSLLVVGDVARPHGLRGEVVVRLTSDQPERVAPGAHLETDDRTLVVVSSRSLKDRYVVAFEGFDSPEAAEALRGAVLRAAPLERDGALWVDELIGARVVDVHGAELGVVTTVEANPASDLLVLDGGGLIPARFVVGDVRDGVVTVEVPEGLLE